MSLVGIVVDRSGFLLVATKRELKPLVGCIGYGVGFIFWLFLGRRCRWGTS